MDILVDACPQCVHMFKFCISALVKHFFSCTCDCAFYKFISGFYTPVWEKKRDISWKHMRRWAGGIQSICPLN